jgi:hypothetical protein
LGVPLPGDAKRSQRWEHYKNQPLPIEKLLEHAKEQGFGVIIGLLTLPMLIPLPVPIPGFSTILGLGVGLLGMQLMLSFQYPTLPKRLAQFELPPALSQGLLKNINRLLRPLEKLSRPRLFRISNSLFFRRLLGLCLMWNALLMGLPLPIPFTNVIPAYAILALTIGILEDDGLFILLGYGMTGLSTAFFASIAGAVWALLITFSEAIQQLWKR